MQIKEQQEIKMLQIKIMKNWTIWCSIWQQLIKGRLIKQKLKVGIHKLHKLELVLHIEMKKDKQKINGLKMKK